MSDEAEAPKPEGPEPITIRVRDQVRLRQLETVESATRGVERKRARRLEWKGGNGEATQEFLCSTSSWYRRDNDAPLHVCAMQLHR